MSSTILLFLGVLSAIFAGTNSKGTLFQSSDNITHALPDAVSTTTQPILIDIQPNDFLADDLIRPSDKVSDTDLFVPPSLFQANTVGAANTLECTHPRKEFGLLDGFQFVAYDICHKVRDDGNANPFYKVNILTNAIFILPPRSMLHSDKVSIFD